MSQTPPPPWEEPESGRPAYPPPGASQQPPSYPPPGGDYPPPPPPGGGYPPPPPAGGYPGGPGGYQPPFSGGGYQQGGYPPPPASGYPVPPPAGAYASRTGQLAGWWRRVGATVVDGILVGIVAGIVTAAASRLTGDIISQVLYAVYLIVLIGLYGQTLGNRVVATRTIDAVNGQIPGYGKAAIRWVTTFVLGITVIGGILDVLWPLWDSRNQTIHDKAAGTLVVMT